VGDTVACWQAIHHSRRQGGLQLFEQELAGTPFMAGFATWGDDCDIRDGSQSFQRLHQ
jgi:hypothetical protein